MKNIEKKIHHTIDEVLARELKNSLSGKNLTIDTRREQAKPQPKATLKSTKSPKLKKTKALSKAAEGREHAPLARPKVKDEILIIQELRDRLERMEEQTKHDHRELIRAHDYARELEHQLRVKDETVRGMEIGLQNAQADLEDARAEHQKTVEALEKKLEKKKGKQSQERYKLLIKRAD